jgi:hypothetical protein
MLFLYLPVLFMQHSIFFSALSLQRLNKMVMLIADYVSFQQSLCECNPSSQHPSQDVIHFEQASNSLVLTCRIIKQVSRTASLKFSHILPVQFWIIQCLCGMVFFVANKPSQPVSRHGVLELSMTRCCSACPISHTVQIDFKQNCP